MIPGIIEGSASPGDQCPYMLPRMPTTVAPSALTTSPLSKIYRFPILFAAKILQCSPFKGWDDKLSITHMQKRHIQ